MIDECEKFGARIVNFGSSNYVLIPINVMKFSGWELGDELVVLAKKKKKED